MNRFITRLRPRFVHVRLGFTAIVTAGGTHPLPVPARGGLPIRRWAPVLSRRLTNDVTSHLEESGPEAFIDQVRTGSGLWRWQDAEGIDKSLAYSR